MEFTIKLTDYQLFRLAEFILFNYMSARLEETNMAQHGEGAPQEHAYVKTFGEAARESLHTLLDEPLKNRTFRGEFRKYFTINELSEFREICWPLIEELTQEKH